MIHICDDCGGMGAFLRWSGYSHPVPDVAPTYSEWQELWLCDDCENDRMFPRIERERHYYK